MSTVSEVVTVVIEIKDAAVQQTGFNVPMIVATHTYWAEPVRTFEEPSELLLAPFNVPDDAPLYLMARAIKSQKPSPERFKVGKRTAATAGALPADLAAIRAADPDFRAFYIDSRAKAEIVAAAAWAEAEKPGILFFATTGDVDALVAPDEDSADVGTTLQAAGYHRTVTMYHESATQHAAAAWSGRMLAKAPGSATYANKSLAGVDKSALSAGARAALTAKNVNYYVDVKGIGFTLHGVAASGRFIDITDGMDWFDVRVQERIVGLFANSDKVPYTDKGTELIRAQIVAQVLEGISAGIIDGDSPWSVTVPLVAAVNSADKIIRTLPRAKFNFVLQGAIHKVAIEGTVLIAL